MPWFKVFQCIIINFAYSKIVDVLKIVPLKKNTLKLWLGALEEELK